MPQLDHLIDRWAESLKTSEPRLERHLDEIKDHVRTDAESRIHEGVEVATAFAAAIGTFGAPRDVAIEFLRSAIPARALVLRFAGAYLLVALVLTAAIVLIDNYYPLNVMWIGIGLVNIMILPAVAVPFYLERLHARHCHDLQFDVRADRKVP